MSHMLRTENKPNWMDVVALAGATASPLTLRFNRGMLDDPPHLLKPIKRRITSMVRELLPEPFERTADAVRAKHRLEWFRVVVDHHSGVVSEVNVEQPTGGGTFTKYRVLIGKGTQRRPNENFRQVDSQGIEVPRSRLI